MNKYIGGSDSLFGSFQGQPTGQSFGQQSRSNHQTNLYLLKLTHIRGVGFCLRARQGYKTLAGLKFICGEGLWRQEYVTQ